jgi:hypothetical protein
MAEIGGFCPFDINNCQQCPSGTVLRNRTTRSCGTCEILDSILRDSYYTFYDGTNSRRSKIHINRDIFLRDTTISLSPATLAGFTTIEDAWPNAITSEQTAFVALYSLGSTTSFLIGFFNISIQQNADGSTRVNLIPKSVNNLYKPVGSTLPRFFTVLTNGTISWNDIILTRNETNEF